MTTKEPVSPKKLKIFLSAGEASGDLLASSLFLELKKRSPTLEAYGITGKTMKDAGIQSLLDISALNVMGFTDVIKKLSDFKRLQLELLKLMDLEPPDLVILVDYQEFHQSLGEQLKLRNIPCVLYIAPQIWAWRKSRVKKLKSKIDLILGILPFEKEFFAPYNINYHFIGSNVYDRTKKLHKKTFSSKAPFKLGFFPGSRFQEIKSILPVMLEVIKKMPSSNIKPILHFKSSFERKILTELVKTCRGTYENNLIKIKKDDGKILEIESASTDSMELMAKVDFAVITSGTASLECAFIGTPLVVLYKTSLLNYQIAKRLALVSSISLPNLILKKPIIKEFIQDINPLEVASYIQNFFANKEKQKEMSSYFLDLRKFFPEDSSKKAAQVVLDFLDHKIPEKN